MLMTFRSITIAAVCVALTGALAFEFRELTVEVTDPEVQFVDGKVFYRHQLFTGKMIERNLNHDLLARVHYKDGEKEGTSYTYHHNGVVVAKNFFLHGKKEGQQESWYADGKHRSTSWFRQGIAEGTLTEWHPNGKIYRLQTIEDGIEKENKIFYESGVIYSNYVVKGNRTYGIQGEPLCNTVKQEGFK
jgi:antitoxin component YwqK of YwqJK toxin-antitoxin module